MREEWVRGPTPTAEWGQIDLASRPWILLMENQLLEGPMGSTARRKEKGEVGNEEEVRTEKGGVERAFRVDHSAAHWSSMSSGRSSLLVDLS